MTPEDEPLRSESVQYATREEQTAVVISSRKNEEAMPRWKGHSAVAMSFGKSQVQCYKEQSAQEPGKLGP